MHSGAPRWITCHLGDDHIELWASTHATSSNAITAHPVDIRLTSDFILALMRLNIRVSRIITHPSENRLHAKLSGTITSEALQEALELYCVQLTWDPKEVYCTFPLSEVGCSTII